MSNDLRRSEQPSGTKASLVEQRIDEFVDGIAVLRPYTRVTGELKRRLVSLIAEERQDELELVRNIEGSTVEAWASPAYQHILGRIAKLAASKQFKK